MSLVLGLRPGELFALRWDDIDGYSLRLDESTVDGEVYPSLKTEKSRGFLALPASLRGWSGRMERLFRQPETEAGVHFSERRWRRTSTGQLSELMSCGRHWIASPKKLALDGIDFRACRRTCATHLSKHGGIKDVQAHLRHSRATTTLDVYVQEIPEAVREAVECLDSVFASAETDTEDNKTK